MPDHSSWFNFIIPNFQEILARFRENMGLSLINKTPVEIQYVIGFVFIVVVLLLLMLTARGRIVSKDNELELDGRFSPRTFFEAMIEGTLSQMEAVMERKDALFFLPLIGTCAFVILFSNLIGLVPGFLPPTSNLSTTFAMAGVVFFVTHLYGCKEHGVIGYFAHWCGPIRKWYALPLMLLMFCIEIVSHLARPLSLSVRLMGNMYADHAVVGTFAGLVPVFLPIPVMLLGVVVCIVQTAVFCILSMVYIGMAVAHEEH